MRQQVEKEREKLEEEGEKGLRKKRRSHNGPEPHVWEKLQVTRGFIAGESVSIVVLDLPNPGI